jgi:hypothetical protein
MYVPMSNGKLPNSKLPNDKMSKCQIVDDDIYCGHIKLSTISQNADIIIGPFGRDLMHIDFEKSLPTKSYPICAQKGRLTSSQQGLYLVFLRCTLMYYILCVRPCR